MDRNGTTDKPVIGQPTLTAVREPLRHDLADRLFTTGQLLLELSREVDQRRISNYEHQGEVIGTALMKITLLCGQLASLSEAEGGKMHGRQTPTFPDADPVVQDQVQRFRERRELERTQRRARPPELEFDPPPDLSADPQHPSEYP